MAQVTETVARGILAGHGYTDNEVRQLAHHWLASHGQAPAETGNSVSAQADSVQEDAALWHWLAEYLVGTRTDLDDEIVASETVNDLRKLVKAAIKQGASHDR